MAIAQGFCSGIVIENAPICHIGAFLNIFAQFVIWVILFPHHILNENIRFLVCFLQQHGKNYKYEQGRRE